VSANATDLCDLLVPGILDWQLHPQKKSFGIVSKRQVYKFQEKYITSCHGNLCEAEAPCLVDNLWASSVKAQPYVKNKAVLRRCIDILVVEQADGHTSEPIIMLRPLRDFSNLVGSSVTPETETETDTASVYRTASTPRHERSGSSIYRWLLQPKKKILTRRYWLSRTFLKPLRKFSLPTRHESGVRSVRRLLSRGLKSSAWTLECRSLSQETRLSLVVALPTYKVHRIPVLMSH